MKKVLAAWTELYLQFGTAQERSTYINKIHGAKVIEINDVDSKYLAHIKRPYNNSSMNAIRIERG